MRAKRSRARISIDYDCIRLFSLSIPYEVVRPIKYNNAFKMDDIPCKNKRTNATQTLNFNIYIAGKPPGCDDVSLILNELKAY